MQLFDRLRHIVVPCDNPQLSCLIKKDEMLEFSCLQNRYMLWKNQRIVPKNKQWLAEKWLKYLFNRSRPREQYLVRIFFASSALAISKAEGQSRTWLFAVLRAYHYERVAKHAHDRTYFKLTLVSYWSTVSTCYQKKIYFSRISKGG